MVRKVIEKKALSTVVAQPPPSAPLLQTALADVEVIPKRNRSKRDWARRQLNWLKKCNSSSQLKGARWRNTYALRPKLGLLWLDLELTEVPSPSPHPLCRPQHPSSLLTLPARVCVISQCPSGFSGPRHLLLWVLGEV